MLQIAAQKMRNLGLLQDRHRNTSCKERNNHKKERIKVFIVFAVAIFVLVLFCITLPGM